MRNRTNPSISASLGLILCACGTVLAAPNAKDILKSTDRSNGLCVLVNVSDSELAVAIGKESAFLVHALHENAATVTAMRKVIDSHNMYGRVSVSRASLGEGRLPYAENLVNLLVIPNSDQGISHDEVMRVLAPLGIAYINGTKTVKPYPKAMDEWTHYRHNAEGNMVSQDELVAPPRHVRWVTHPIWQRSHALTPGTTAMVTTQGRIFYIHDESPIGFAGLPDQWRLIARDAFNGKLLWKRDMGAWGDTAWSWWSGGHSARQNHPIHVTKRLVVDKNRVFVTLGYNTPVSCIDAASGKTLIEYKGTQYADEMVCHNGILYVSVNDRPQKSLPGKGFSTRATSQNDSKKTIMAIEPESGKVLWKAGPYAGVGGGRQRLASMKQVVMIASEKGVFIHDDKDLLGLDLKTGKERFRVPSKAEGKVAAIYHRGMVIVAGRKAAGFDAETGKCKWQIVYNSIAGGLDIPEVFAIGDLIWLGEGKQMFIKAVHYVTGKEVRRVSIAKVLVDAGHHHRCYPNRSTVKYLITGRRGAEFTDYKTGEVIPNHWARGQCRLGHVPANGLLYKLPDPCTCHLRAKLLGFYALASADSASDFFQNIKIANPLQKGKAYRDTPAEEFSAASQWPTFRHDQLRSGSVKTTLPDSLEKAWEVQVSAKLSPPVIAAGRVYVSAVDQCKVYAFDARNGKELWSRTVGGAVDSPPTIHKGIVLFGSRDGWVYCLRAKDGELAWRFRAAPYDRNIVAYERVESAWPVHGSVLVSNGVAYCTAGRSSFVDGGIYLYALDAASGGLLDRQVIHEVQTQNGGGAKTMPDEAPGAGSDILVSNGKSIYMRDRKLNFKVELKQSADDYVFPVEGPLNTRTNFFDQHWFHRTAWRYGKTNGYMIAFNANSAWSVFTYKTPGSGQHKLYVPRGGDISMIPDKHTVTEDETGLKHLPEIETDGFLLTKRCVDKSSVRFPGTPH